MRCWGASPFAEHHGDRPWAHPSSRAPLRDVAVLSGPQRQTDLEDCVVDAHDTLVCARARAPARMDVAAGLYELRWFPPLQTPPELRDVRAASIAHPRVCVLARAGSEEAAAAWCVDREPVPDPHAPVVRSGFRRMPLGAPRAIALNARELCALYDSGPVRCMDPSRDEVRDVAGTDGAVQLALGEDFGCVRDAVGTVSCWGENEAGQLGDGTFVSRADARPIAIGRSPSDVAAFGRRACAVRDGVAWCWGLLRPRGSLDEVVSATPVKAADLSDVRTLAISEWFACATRADGTVWCWGNDAAGQLGNGASMPHRGCQREGISGTSAEQERLHPPTPVRTGEAGAYPRARGPMFAFVLALACLPLALVVEARKRSRLDAAAALVVATFVPMLITRLANATLATWFDSCRAWACAIPTWSRSMDAFMATFGVAASFGFVAHGYGRLRSAPDERSGARVMARFVVCGAIPSLLCSMHFTRTVVSTSSGDALAYLLRDRALEGIRWPFVAQWCWTMGWFVIAIAFAPFAWVGRAQRR